MPLIAAVLVVVEIGLSNEFAGMSRNAMQLDSDIETLRTENELLSQKVASASSLLTIEAKAAAMGFTATPTYLSLGEEQVALQNIR